MSCIDAAIIKALVEHIGMNPEDVPVGSPHECIKYTAGEGINISGDNVISATENSASVETYRDDCTLQSTNSSMMTSIFVYTPADKPLGIGDTIRYVADGTLTTWHIVWRHKELDDDGAILYQFFNPDTGSIIKVRSIESSINSAPARKYTILHPSTQANIDKSFSKESGAGVYATTDFISGALFGLIYHIIDTYQLKTT